MQVAIGVITLAVAVHTHQLVVALAFFAMMQIGAILGALWGVQLKNRISRTRGRSRA